MKFLIKEHIISGYGEFSDYTTNGSDYATQRTSQLITNEGGSNYDWAWSHLPKDNPVHKCWAIHPITDLNNFVKHQRHGSKSAAKSDQVNSEHQQAQIEQRSVEKEKQKKADYGDRQDQEQWLCVRHYLYGDNGISRARLLGSEERYAYQGC